MTKTQSRIGESTMKTVIHAYSFWINEPAQAEAYNALCEKLKAEGLECMEPWGGQGHYEFVKDIDGREIELEDKYLFDNQWNTAPIDGISENGLRVFDWAQDYPINFSKSLKKGHYLEQTPEMREARRNRVKCGYCGNQQPRQKGLVFCDQCLDSAYLKESDLYLIRMIPVTDGRHEGLVPLSEAELNWLLPQYREAQIKGSTERGKARIKKEREDIERKYQQTIKHAKEEHDGLLWLMDNGISTENVIYYSHIERFSFGWRRAIDESLKSSLLEALTEFPFSYEIKCADGKKLEAIR